MILVFAEKGTQRDFLVLHRYAEGIAAGAPSCRMAVAMVLGFAFQTLIIGGIGPQFGLEELRQEMPGRILTGPNGLEGTLLIAVKLQR